MYASPFLPCIPTSDICLPHSEKLKVDTGSEEERIPFGTWACISGCAGCSLVGHFLRGHRRAPSWTFPKLASWTGKRRVLFVWSDFVFLDEICLFSELSDSLLCPLADVKQGSTHLRTTWNQTDMKTFNLWVPRVTVSKRRVSQEPAAMTTPRHLLLFFRDRGLHGINTQIFLSTWWLRKDFIFLDASYYFCPVISGHFTSTPCSKVDSLCCF